MLSTVNINNEGYWRFLFDNLYASVRIYDYKKIQFLLHIITNLSMVPWRRT